MKVGIGGAALPVDAAARKTHPIATGVIDYFPLALAEIARVSYEGNKQHNGDSPLHWDRTKSTDEADALIRHFLERGKVDTDGMRHSAKMAWRALALLQKEIEQTEAEQITSTRPTQQELDDHCASGSYCDSPVGLSYCCTRPSGHSGSHVAHNWRGEVLGYSLLDQSAEQPAKSAA